MNTSSHPLSLHITRTQAQKLVVYIQSYRRLAWENSAPSAKRNATIRSLQAVQGKLLSAKDQQNTTITILLLITSDELLAMNILVSDLLKLSASNPVASERNTALADLTGLKTSLERSHPHPQQEHDFAIEKNLGDSELT